MQKQRPDTLAKNRLFTFSLLLCCLSIFPNASAELTDATKSLASGTGLQYATAGVLAQFTVTAKDESGVRRTSGGDDFVVELEGTRSVTGSVIDNLDGTYPVSYTVTKSGYIHDNIICDCVSAFCTEDWKQEL
jgi:hypothetical protein